MELMEEALECASDDQLIDEIECRGYTVYTDGDIEEHLDAHDMKKDLENLYLDYMLTKEFFEPQLRKFFNFYLGKTLR